VSTAELLEMLVERGAVMIVMPGGVLRVAGIDLEDEVATLIRHHKPELLRLTSLALTYRKVLRRAWALTTQGEAASPVECGGAVDDVVRLIDEVGEPLADRLRHCWEREWATETGRCPRCGEPGEPHA
jgi:hypothetical protein